MNDSQLLALLAKSSSAYIARAQEVLAAVPIREVGLLIERLIAAREEGRTVFIFGNGGSAATASHMANDLSKGTIRPGAPRLRALALSDNVSLLTAWANDTDYTQVFAEQLLTHARPGDMVIAISASGSSPNVVEGIQAARGLGLYTVGLLGFQGGEARGMVDLAIVVPSDHYGLIEDAHLVINHLASTVMTEFAGPRRTAVPGFRTR